MSKFELAKRKGITPEQDRKMTLNVIQGALAIGSLYPPLTVPLSLINAAIYLARNNKSDAAWEMAGVIPFGRYLKYAKFEKWLKLAKEV